MCGIAGIVLCPSVELADLCACMNRVRDTMTHRGPDDAGTYLDARERVALVNRRLAIRDLSPLGHMPMVLEDESVALTYNGEIYNADELRTELERAGIVFRSTSDTEVILRGYMAWGKSVIARLRGIFAIALYDVRQARVLLARDQLGIKPLYYAQTDIGLLFASELKAMRAFGWVSTELDPVAIIGYLELGAVPTPRTIYRHIHALEPATLMSVELATLEKRTTRYWTLPTQERAMPTDVVAETRAALLDAVRSQLVSDVPLGAFLSGGLDSSAVVAMMREATNGTLRTCSMVFEESAYSEASFARAVAEQVGAEHFERVVTASDVLNEMPRVLWALDQPSIDGVNSYFVSQTARQAGLTVALSGLGGDELFGGYPSFHAAPRLYHRLQQLQRIPAAPTVLGVALSFAPRYAKLADILQVPASPASAYLAYRGVFAPAEARTLVRPEIWDEAKSFDAVDYVAARANDAKQFAAPDGRASVRNPQSSIKNTKYAWTSRAELSTYTLNQLVRDTDAMSMAHSLEVRVPLLDHRLVEYILTLPDAAKQNGGTAKPLLQKALGDALPAIVRERRVKQGFTFPFDRWLRRDLFKGFVRSACENGAVLEPRAVAGIWESFARGQIHWSRAWSVLVLNAWLQTATGS